MKSFTFIDLFAGIGGMRIAFDRLGGECVFSSEWDKRAQDSYEANFGHRPDGDITQIKAESIPNHDILLAGFPCQPFSIMGDKLGFADTRGTLFFDIERILDAKRPTAFLLENVKQLVSHDGGMTFGVIRESLTSRGYTVYTRVLNALDYGLPQKRERIMIVGFRDDLDFVWPEPRERVSLHQVLEPHDEVDESLFASEDIQQQRLARLRTEPPVPSIWHQNKGGNISALPYSCALRAGASYNYLLVDGKRRLSGREMLRLQGFPDDFKIVVPYTQIRKQAGNAVPINMIEAVARQMMQSLGYSVPSEKSKPRQRKRQLRQSDAAEFALVG